MGKSRRFNPDDEIYEEKYFPEPKKQKEKTNKNIGSVTQPITMFEVIKQPKEEERNTMGEVTVKGTVVFGYKTDNGDVKWFEEKQTRSSGDQKFLDTGKDLIRLYMKGIKLQTGYVLSWKNAFTEEKK